MPGSQDSVLRGREKWEGGTVPTAQASRAAHPTPENQGPAGCFRLISSLVPLPGSCSLPPWREGRKKGSLETIKAVAFTFRERAGEDCFQVASRGPSPPGGGRGWARRHGPWAGRAGGAPPTAQNVFFSQSWQAARFLIGSRLRASLLRAFPHHLNPIGNPAPWLPIGPALQPDAEGPLRLPSCS